MTACSRCSQRRERCWARAPSPGPARDELTAPKTPIKVTGGRGPLHRAGHVPQSCQSTVEMDVFYQDGPTTADLAWILRQRRRGQHEQADAKSGAEKRVLQTGVIDPRSRCS